MIIFRSLNSIVRALIHIYRESVGGTLVNVPNIGAILLGILPFLFTVFFIGWNSLFISSIDSK
jgi:hypothetical protein